MKGMSLAISFSHRVRKQVIHVENHHQEFVCFLMETFFFLGNPLLDYKIFILLTLRYTLSPAYIEVFFLVVDIKETCPDV